MALVSKIGRHDAAEQIFAALVVTTFGQGRLGCFVVIPGVIQ